MPHAPRGLREVSTAILRPLAGPALGAFAGPSALACPVCRSETGERVRQAILGPELGWNVVATTLPFLVLFTIVAGVFFSAPASHGLPEEPR